MTGDDMARVKRQETKLKLLHDRMTCLKYLIQSYRIEAANFGANVKWRIDDYENLYRETATAAIHAENTLYNITAALNRGA